MPLIGINGLLLRGFVLPRCWGPILHQFRMKEVPRLRKGREAREISNFSHPEDPSLNRSDAALFFFEVWLEEGPERSVQIGSPQRFGNAEGIVLMRIAVLLWKVFIPQGWVYLSDNGFPDGNTPTVKGPEVYSISSVSADITKPRNPGVCGFGYGPCNIEVKNRLGFAANFGESSPTRVAGSWILLAAEIDVVVRMICGPVFLKIIQECRPIVRQVMQFEILNRKREAMIDADDRWLACA